MVSFGLMAQGDEGVRKPESEVTEHDLDRQIRFLKDNIEKYKGLAKTFDRKAGNLQSQDYTGSRDAAVLRDECRGIATDLEAHLVKLEGQREQMLEQQNAKK
jgi:flagellar motility protein MotE (MotC chaperone)